MLLLGRNTDVFPSEHFTRQAVPPPQGLSISELNAHASGTGARGGWQSLSSPGRMEPVATLLLGRKSEGRKLLPAVPGPILRVLLLPLTEPQA